MIATIPGLLALLITWILGFQLQDELFGILITALLLVLLAFTVIDLALFITAVSKDTGTAGEISAVFIVPIMLFGTLLAIFNGATLKIAKLMPDYNNSETLIRVLHLGKCIRSGCLEKYAYSAGNHCGRRNCRSWVVQQN